MAPTTRSQTRRARPDALIIKLLRTGRRHYDHTYTEGLNVCTQPWNDEECGSGGLYACELRHIFEWINLYPDITEVAWVDVPADAHVARFDTKIKASALVLTGFMPIEEAIRLAIQAGADVHAVDDQALRWASRYGHLSVVKVLVKAGADVHAADDDALRSASASHADNDYALRRASMYGHLSIVKVLVKAGADVHADNDYALRWASFHGHLAVVKVLVKAGANVHAVDDQALRYASQDGHLPVVEVLVTAGANVHAVDDQALRFASERGHLPVVEFLKTLP